jgi:ADP-L-glycero-D-manno-heptose 6-epimerase
MIVITGARGFIGSNLVQQLNHLGFNNLVLVDELENEAKNDNISGLKFSQCIHRNDFFSWLANAYQNVNFIFHLGARTDTTEQNEAVFEALNLNYSKKLFSFCTDKQIPLLYASSAATYGDGTLAYDDTLDPTKLQALNPYGKVS